MNRYQFLDSGNGKKLEQFGSIRLIRPCSQAVWHPTLNPSEWKKSHGEFIREEGWKGNLPKQWEMQINRIHFILKPTDFGHLGVFPEHEQIWNLMYNAIQPHLKVLNLFAYTGAATISVAHQKAEVCHLDASPKSVAWAKELAHMNHLQEAPIRWIVDDAMKFLKREVKRNVRYDGIVLDPPSFGRGKKQEVFKIENHILDLLDLVKQVLVDHPKFVFFSSHTPGFTPIVLQNLLKQSLDFHYGSYISDELCLIPQKGMKLPMGAFAGWIDG